MNIRVWKAYSACAMAVIAAAGLAACSPAEPEQPSGPVTLTVSDLPPANQAAQREKFLKNVADFEKANPLIDVVPAETRYEVQTFQARMAGGTAETVIAVPFTEPSGLIQRGHIQDISTELKASELGSKLNPQVLDIVRRGDKVYGVPIFAYTIGLAYNRGVFIKAGLDPDKPPRTWEEVRETAKKLKGHVEAPFSLLTKENGGGWHLSAMTYSYGGLMEREKDGKFVTAFNSEPTKKALQLLKDMRWTDDTMGAKQLRNFTDGYRDFAAGEIGMIISVPDTYGSFTTQYKADPKNYGVTSLPQGGGNATLTGGGLWVVTAKADARQRAAAVKWIDFLLQESYLPERAEAAAKASAADGLPVGIPTLPIFDQATTDKINAAIKPYVNFPVAQATGYIQGSKTIRLQPEPEVSAQELYGALDPAVQAVLTRPDANIDELLATGDATVSAILKRAQ